MLKVKISILSRSTLHNGGKQGIYRQIIKRKSIFFCMLLSLLLSRRSE